MRLSGAGEQGPPLYAEADDGELIAYRVFPAAVVQSTDARALPPVLLVHGFAADARITWVATGWVGALHAAGRDVIAFDLRGHGDSDAPIDPAAYAPQVLGGDIRAVLDSAGAEVVDLVAYSLGNRVASAFTAVSPRRVRRMVVGGAGPQELFASVDLDEARALLLDGVAPSHPLVAQVLAPAVAAGADPEVLLACIAGVAGVPLDVPHDIPVLFVAGENDPVPRGARELAASWGADYVELPGRDHVSALTARAFKDAAVAFLT